MDIMESVMMYDSSKKVFIRFTNTLFRIGMGVGWSTVLQYQDYRGLRHRWLIAYEGNSNDQ
jgi:hypothetical protein